MPSKYGKSTHINSNATTQVKAEDGFLHRIVINDPGSSWSVAVYDDDDGTDDLIADIVPDETKTLEFSIGVATGIRVVTSGMTPGSVTVVYE